jgi:alkylation response protein AidB-like acyl-CoA dehydrogenase
MNLLPSPDQEVIAAAVREFLAAEMPLARVRALADSGGADPIDTGTWRRCADLGWLALGLSEQDGGLGAGLAEEVMVFRELGRFLSPGPFLSSSVGARVAAQAGCPRLAADIASGRRRVGMAIGDRVLDARSGELLLRLDGDAAVLAEIEDAAPVAALDPATRLATVRRSAVIARAEDPLLLPRTQVLAGAMLLGITEAVRDMSAAYARTRVQFGRPVGAFQAVKHRCADMAVAAYATVGQLHQAALYVGSAHPDAAFHAAAAYVLAVRGASRSAADNIQNHGAIGFTWEHDAHLYVKRVVVLENFFGPLRSAYAAVMAPPRHEFR